jgi:hypothetical protein
MDWSLVATVVGIVVPVIGTVVGGWAVMRKQGERNEQRAERNEQALQEATRRFDQSVEALSKRLDEKFEKHLLALTSVQEVAGESMRRVLAAWGRIEEESRLSSLEREERARLQEQMHFQRDLINELKRTQELNLADVRRAIERRES